MAFKENKNIKKKKKHLYAVLDSLLQILEKKVVLLSDTSQSFNGGLNSEKRICDNNADDNVEKLLPSSFSGKKKDVDNFKSITEWNL